MKPENITILTVVDYSVSRDVPSNQFNIQLQQQIGVFQASMLEAMKSLREEM